MLIRSITLVLYNFAIFCYQLAIYLAFPINNKSRQWVRGRKNLFHKLQQEITEDGFKVWMHVSSLGEFEQGRPIIEALKSESPRSKIILTFFSPSGFELRKNYEFAEIVSYLPLDTPNNANKFIELVNPNLAIFIKYDFWYHYFKKLKDHNIPLLLVSSIFRKNQIYFKPYGGFFRKLLQIPDHIFVQNKDSQKLLRSRGINNTTVINDSRIDRVIKIQNSLQNENISQAKFFKGNSAILTIGSSYQNEERLVFQALSNELEDWKIIIAPHHVNRKRIDEIKRIFKDYNCVLWTQYPTENQLTNAQILLVDTIGLLNTLYSLSEIAFIGGGFNKSIHNLLEPAVFGNAILFGPAGYEKFKEAVDLVNCEGAMLVQSPEMFQPSLSEIIKGKKYLKMGTQAKQYIDEHKGGSIKVMDYIIDRYPKINYTT